ncbi:MAG: DUF86 domain-containing protein [Ignavibacteriales bacterium CG_4_9_14_3_um_filter_30_11]|nr:MAG: DUF86 domain-containing protein [Ignavibacteriales bacterium CG_4_9_14_3_um_filter_30_11]
MIDKVKTEKLLSELEEFIKSLEDLLNFSVEEYLDEKRNIYSGRYLLQISIETCINISNHIVSRMKLGLPNEYADAFRLLNKNDIISYELLEKMILMTRFRNRVVHMYWDIDDSYVFDLINNNLKDVIEFKESIKKYLNNIDN